MNQLQLKGLSQWRDAFLNAPIRVKMAGAFSAIFALIALSAGLVFFHVWDGVQDLQELQATEVPLLQIANDLRYYDVVLTDAVRAYVFNPQDSAAYERYFAYAQRYDSALAEARQIANEAEDRAIFAQIDAISAEMTVIEQSLMANPDLQQFEDVYTGRYRELRGQLSEQINMLLTVHSEHNAEGQAHIVEHFYLSLVIILIAVVILSAACFAIAAALTRYIVGNLTHMTAVSREFAKGNLEARVTIANNDELGVLGEALNKAAANEQRYILELENARRQAEDATRMKDLFLATMSHELRTPLNAMIGFLHLMIYSDQLDEDNTYMAERSLANTQRLLTLINNILDLSRIATGGLQIVPAPLQIRYMIAGLYNDLKMLAHDKGLRLALDVDHALPETINHDETRLSQIITNLVGNAIKFTERGEVTLQVKQQEDKLMIRVSDTGIGIPKAKLGLIFDDFFQVDASSTRQQQGAGLGLAIVKRLVMLMDGKINVESKVGVGSTFTVELPLELPAFNGQPKTDQEHAVFASSIDQARLAPSLN
ncbi:ATP-binding protein [Aggregatilineales bacterium SYSU G02658]